MLMNLQNILFSISLADNNSGIIINSPSFYYHRQEKLQATSLLKERTEMHNIFTTVKKQKARLK